MSVLVRPSTTPLCGPVGPLYPALSGPQGREVMSDLLIHAVEIVNS